MKKPSAYFRTEFVRQTENGRRLKTKVVESKKTYSRKRNRKPDL